tara:strand:+ start:486 stop:680 length:195 start_codon:yes stop_codon:yes gene_type:complete
MKYNNIKGILKKQIDNGVKTFWTFDEDTKEFTQIYKNYTNELQIFTAKQLLIRIKTIEEDEVSV